MSDQPSLFDADEVAPRGYPEGLPEPDPLWSPDDPLFPDSATLGQAKRELRPLLKKGHVCPCCGRFARIWPRTINSSQARGLIRMWQMYGTEFGYIQDVRRVDAKGNSDNREEPKLRYWFLVEEENVRRPDGGRAGWWRVTELGRRWLHGETAIPKYALVYNAVCLGQDGPPVTIHDALGKNFDLAELLATEV